MHRARFELARLSSLELETNPLDHSGICAFYISTILMFLLSIDCTHNVHVWAYFGGISVEELKALEYEMLVFVDWNVIYM